MHFSTCTRPLSLLFLFCAPRLCRLPLPPLIPTTSFLLPSSARGKVRRAVCGSRNGYSIALRAVARPSEFSRRLDLPVPCLWISPGHSESPGPRVGIARQDQLSAWKRSQTVALRPGDLRQCHLSGNISRHRCRLPRQSRQMEFDLVLRPGADPKQIRLKFGGAGDLTLDPDARSWSIVRQGISGFPCRWCTRKRRRQRDH